MACKFHALNPTWIVVPRFMTSAKQNTTPLRQLSFEAALAELEQIVRGLETGQMKLEDAISAYERGAALRRHCEERLAEAEMRVKAIVQKADGSLSEDSFDPTEKPAAAPRKKKAAAPSPTSRDDHWDSKAGLDDEIPF